MIGLDWIDMAMDWIGLDVPHKIVVWIGCSAQNSGLDWIGASLLVGLLFDWADQIWMLINSQVYR